MSRQIFEIVNLHLLDITLLAKLIESIFKFHWVKVNGSCKISIRLDASIIWVNVFDMSVRLLGRCS